MGESQFLQVTASILSTLQNSQGFSQSYGYPQTHPATPFFDTQASGSSLGQQSSDFSSHVSSMGLPAALTGEILTLLSRDSSDYQCFIQQAQSRLLHELSLTTVSSTPEQVPSLIDAACTSFYNRVLASRLEKIREQAHDYELRDGSLTESDETGSDKDSVVSESDDSDRGLEEDIDEPEEDENAPIRPGEEVPPLETKYLPIFEALHERGKVLTKPEKTYLVNMTGMTYRQITIWFQNRRRGELKDQNQASVSRASSVYSDESSGFSESGLDAQLSRQPDTTFNIRSWQLASAIATKNDQTSSFPPSPTKVAFGPVDIGPDAGSDTDLSDTDDEFADVPPGLKVPSLTSMTTADSGSERDPMTVASNSSLALPSTLSSGNNKAASRGWSSRPIKALPSSRHGPPPVPAQHATASAPPLNFNFASAMSAPPSVTCRPVTGSGSSQPTQSVTSNERGLTVEMHTGPPNSATLACLQTPMRPASTNHTSNMLPSSSPSSAGSCPDVPSPPPGRGTVSPRPAIKPLPRRTGCAPRPRPPPRPTAAIAATPASSNPPSIRASIVLPPSSNPSLANTTLGALLRPHPPGPTIPSEMEERLSAMAGRMGVSSASGARPTASRTTTPSAGAFSRHHVATLNGSPGVATSTNTPASAVSPKIS
ncbi:unnamed protein product [Rhizoctonia solani]|uniref:Homeobox domain-containing protein n=1 Tax=Rhizoctonia solani TaxID=456999 RepID=A0A8H3HQ61_9AGAM|nr:unnamed protein product [Rhizoctonia solani]